MDKIIIKENKKKIKKIAFVGAGMFAAALLLLYLGIQDKSGLFCIVGGIGSIYFGILFFYNIVRTVRGRNLLILDEEKITDHSTAGSALDIYFKDIKQVKILSNARGQRFLGITMKDQEAFLSALTGFRKQEAVNNITRKQPPILIWMDTAVGVTIDQLLELITLKLT